MPPQLPGPSGPPLRLIVQNVNGLGSRKKRQSFFKRLQCMHPRPDIALVIESHTGSDQQSLGWVQEGSGPGQPWLGPSFWHHGTRRSRGVGILIREGLCISEPQVLHRDSAGRILAVSFASQEGHTWVVMAVYAPVESDNRASFFSGPLSRACAACPPGASLLMAGDWNCVLSQYDLYTAQQQPSRNTRLVGGPALRRVQDQAGVEDAFRHLHPQTLEFTKTVRNGHSVTSGRTTRWLVSEDLLQLGWVTACQHMYGELPGDHAACTLQLIPTSSPLMGPYGWVFPTYLLSHPPFLESMRGRIEHYLAHPPPGNLSPSALWDDLKLVMKLGAINYHKQWVAEQRRERRGLERAVKWAGVGLQRRPTSRACHTRLQEATQAIQQFDERETAARVVPLDALWADCGEQSTAWFHRLGRTVVDKQPITSIRDPTGGPAAVLNTDAGVKRAGDLLANFYDGALPTGLFHPAAVCAQAQQLMLGAIDATLDAAGQTACLGPHQDGRLTLECMHTALTKSPRGKQPGCDGLQYEFYLVFWELLGPLMVAAFNHSFLSDEEDPAMSCTSRTGIITLIFKGDEKPQDDPDSYRPITLLNTDVKLVAKVLALRMGCPLDGILDVTQTAFVPGRWIGDNVLYHLEEIEYIAATQQSACILGLDFNKAYDRVHRGWLFKCMAALGIPAACCRWVQLLLQGSQAYITYNGHRSRVFEVPAGCAQGSPLSPLLYVISAQPLAARVRQLQAQGIIAPIPLPDGTPAPPMHMHADDTTLHTVHVDDAARVLSLAIVPYEEASGGKLNVPKSWGLALGSHPALVGPHPGTGIIFKGPLEAVRHLGIPLTSGNPATAISALYTGKLKAVCARIRHWGRFKLSKLGRVHVAKQVLATTISYHATFLAPPADTLNSISRVITGYVLKGQLVEEQGGQPLRGRPARPVACLPLEMGGLGMPDLEAHVTGLQAKVPAQLLHPRRSPWKVLAIAAYQRAFPRYGTAVLVHQIPCSGAANARLLPPRHQQYLTAFRRLGLHRRPSFHASMTKEQIGVESLVGNHSVAGRDGCAITNPASLPAGLAGLGLLREVPAEQLPLLKLPPAWGLALGPGPSACQWQVDVGSGAWVRRAQAPNGWEVFKVGPDGRLVPPDPVVGPPPAAHWAPACVVECSAKSTGGVPREQYLVGAWDKVWVDPSVWCLGSVPLLDYTVKHATGRIIQWNCRKAPGWTDGEGIRPKLWGEGDGPAEPTTVDNMAVRQKRRHEEQTSAPPPHERRFSPDALAPMYHPSWFDPSPPRLHVRQRVEAREDGIARQRAAREAALDAVTCPLVNDGVDPIRGSTGVRSWRYTWRRAHHKLLPRPTRLFVWELLHGALPCGGATVSFYPAGHAELECTLCHAPTCQAVPRPLETLQHLFLECPVGRGALQWLSAVWVGVQPAAHPPPPLSAAVWLADDRATWRPGGRGLIPTWNLLRATMLKQIWRARQAVFSGAADEATFTTSNIVGAFVREVQQLIRQDWWRVQGDLKALSGVGPEWLRGRQLGLPPHTFKGRWCARGVLASVTQGPCQFLSVHLAVGSAPLGP